MSERTALEIALDLDAASCSSFVKLEAAESLRQQHAEIERLQRIIDSRPVVNAASVLESELEANAILTDENAGLDKLIGKLWAIVEKSLGES